MRVLAPGPHHDIAIVLAGQRRTYARLLAGGVRIFEYGASMMHAKTLVVDDVAVVGSTNMDSQSLSFLWEVSVVAQAPGPRGAARRSGSSRTSRARRRSGADDWRRRPLRMKLGEGAAGLAEAWL